VFSRSILAVASTVNSCSYARAHTALVPNATTLLAVGTPPAGDGDMCTSHKKSSWGKLQADASTTRPAPHATTVFADYACRDVYVVYAYVEPRCNSGARGCCRTAAPPTEART